LLGSWFFLCVSRGGRLGGETQCNTLRALIHNNNILHPKYNVIHKNSSSCRIKPNKIFVKAFLPFPLFLLLSLLCHCIEIHYTFLLIHRLPTYLAYLSTLHTYHHSKISNSFLFTASPQQNFAISPIYTSLYSLPKSSFSDYNNSSSNNLTRKVYS